MRPPPTGQQYLDRERENTLAKTARSVNKPPFGRRKATSETGGPNCGGPCLGAGALPWPDAEATFEAYRGLVHAWTDETILTMGLPHIDHLGRKLPKGAEAQQDEAASWGVRRQLRDPQTGLIDEIVLEVQIEFFNIVRSGKACLFHLRGLMHTLTERIAWRLATRRALVLMRERLAAKGEALPEPVATNLSPEEIVQAIEKSLVDEQLTRTLDRTILHLSPNKARVVTLRRQGLSHDEISTMLGITPGTARRYFCEACAELARLLKLKR